MAHAEAGEHVTKADAEALIAEAMQAERAKFEALVAQLRADAESETQRAIAAATQHLWNDNQALEAEIARIRDAAAMPDIPELVEQICKSIGKPKLNPQQFQHLACILGTAITDGKKVYPPSTLEESQEAEDNLRIAAPAMRALEYFQTAPDPQAVLGALRPFQIDTATRCIGSAIAWLNELNAQLGRK